MEPEKVLVTGATGQLGALIVKHLLKVLPASSVVAGGRNATRAPAGVEFRFLDYSDPASVEAAMQGITRVVLVSGSEVGKRVPQHQAVIEAAARAGVKLLGYTSILKCDTNPFLLAREHQGTEEVLARGKVPYILLRHGWYSENFASTAPVAIQFGVVNSASGNGRFSTATRDDFAAGDAAMILRDDHQPGQTYELAGSTSFNKREYAEMLSRKSGKKVIVKDLSESDYAAALMQAGVPEVFARIVADYDARSADGWLHDDSRTLEKAIGRPTTPIEVTLDQALAAK